MSITICPSEIEENSGKHVVERFLWWQFEICRFANSPRIWYYRQCIPETPREAHNIKGSLINEDSSRAYHRTYEEWLKLKTFGKKWQHHRQEHPDLVDDQISRQRVITGEIQEVPAK